MTLYQSQARRAVLTSDHHAWLLGGFFHQWKKYDARPIEVVGFTKPPAHLLAGYPFVSLGNFSDYPATRWSDALIKYLENIKEPLIEIWLEDYWLIRKSNFIFIEYAEQYMNRHPDVARFDIASDRLYAAHARDLEAIGEMDLLEAKGAYSLSFQASIWRRRHLLSLLQPGETPWQTELAGSQRLNESPLRVIGSRQGPTRYMIVVNKGQFDRTGTWMYPPRSLTRADWAELDTRNLTKPPQVE